MFTCAGSHPLPLRTRRPGFLGMPQSEPFSPTACRRWYLELRMFGHWATWHNLEVPVGSQNSQIWGWPQQMLHGDTSIISWQRYMASLESWHELAHLLTSTYHWTKIMTRQIWKKVWRCLKHFTSFHIISHQTHQRIRDLFTGRREFVTPRILKIGMSGELPPIPVSGPEVSEVNPFSDDKYSADKWW